MRRKLRKAVSILIVALVLTVGIFSNMGGTKVSAATSSQIDTLVQFMQDQVGQKTHDENGTSRACAGVIAAAARVAGMTSSQLNTKAKYASPFVGSGEFGFIKSDGTLQFNCQAYTWKDFLNGTYVPRKGDFVFFGTISTANLTIKQVAKKDFVKKHVGVLRNNSSTTTKLYTIEGNTTYGDHDSGYTNTKTRTITKNTGYCSAMGWYVMEFVRPDYRYDAADLITNLNYSGKNYLKGTDFTSVDPDLIISRDTSVSELFIDTQNKHNGYNSLKIVNYSAGESGKDLTVYTQTARRRLSGYVGDKKTMTLSFWAKASADGTKLYNRWGYEPTYRSISLTTSWAKYTIRMDKTLDYDSDMHPYIDRSGTVWITEMQLEDGTEATEFVPETQGIYQTVAQTSGNKYKLPAAPARTDCTFDGWYSSASGGTKITTNTEVKNGCYLVYAHWTPIPVTITSQPGNVTAKAGSTANFTVGASGGALTYQWQWRPGNSGTWTDSTSATTGYNTASLKVSATAARDGYQYRCKVTNAAGSTAYSDTVTLRVLGIKTQPSSVTVAENKNVTFTVNATGNNLSYQWQWSPDSGTNWYDSTMAGYNTDTMTVYAKISRNGYKYRCKVSNSAGIVTSNAASLTIVSKPTITSQPKSVSTSIGTTATFKVTASGSGLTYQWQWRSGSNTAWTNSSSATTGYNTATLKVSATAARNGYQYRCVVSNIGGSVTSNTVTLTVLS